MDHVVLVPHFGAGRGRLARSGRATVYSVADAVGSAAFASWTGLVGDRPAGEMLDELARLVPRSAVSALAAFVSDGDGLEVLTVGGAPITVDGRPLSASPSMQRQRIDGAATIELLATGQLADDPLLDFERGVVAADGFTLRRSVAGPTPWEQPLAAAEMATPAAAAMTPAAGAAPMAAAPEPAAAPAAAPEPAPGAAAAHDGQMAASAAAAVAAGHDHDPAGHDHDGHDHDGHDHMAPAAAAAAAPAGLVSLLVGDDDLPEASPLPVAGGPAPVAAEPAPAMAEPSSATTGPAPAGAPAAEAAAAPAGPPVVRVAGLRCARDHFNDPRARFCAVCGIAMHQASFVLTEDVRPALGVITFADGALYSVTGNLVFGRDPDDDPSVRAGTATPAVLVDSQNTISRVHAEVRAVDWDVYLVDRGSTNGTFVWNAAGQQWDRLAPDQPRLIEPGAQISFGRLVAAFDSGLRP